MAIDMPDWNELPENVRTELVQHMQTEIGTGVDWEAGMAALDLYELVSKRLGEFWPEWHRRKREAAAARDMFEDGA